MAATAKRAIRGQKYFVWLTYSMVGLIDKSFKKIGDFEFPSLFVTQGDNLVKGINLLQICIGIFFVNLCKIVEALHCLHLRSKVFTPLKNRYSFSRVCTLCSASVCYIGNNSLFAYIANEKWAIGKQNGRVRSDVKEFF